MKGRDTTALKRTMFGMSTSVLTLLLSFIVGGLLVAIVGVNPFKVYAELFKGGLGNSISLVGTLNRMAPILLAGLAITIGNSCGVFNIGLEGQFLCGSIAAAAVGKLLAVPAWLHIPLVMLAGMLGAMLWALVPVMLNLYREISIIFSAIMLNYVATYLVDYLIPLFPDYEASSNATPRINSTAMLPDISIGGSKINISVLISILAVAVATIILFRMRPGYELRAVGLNRNAAYSAGINVKNRVFWAMMLSAAFAGLSAALELMGSTYRLTHGYNSGYLPLGIAVAMLGKQNPVAVMVAAFLFSAMKNGSTLMQMNTGVSSQFVMALQGLIIIFVCSENFVRYLLRRRGMKRTRRADNA